MPVLLNVYRCIVKPYSTFSKWKCIQSNPAEFSPYLATTTKDQSSLEQEITVKNILLIWEVEISATFISWKFISTRKVKCSTLNIVTAGPSLNYPSNSKSSLHVVFHLLTTEQGKIQMIFGQFMKQPLCSDSELLSIKKLGSIHFFPSWII